MTAAAARVGRFYTAARRHPWVLGKVADWKIKTISAQARPAGPAVDRDRRRTGLISVDRIMLPMGSRLGALPATAEGRPGQ